MRVERELMRGAGPVAVLKLLERGEMYGYELVTALAEKTSGVLDMGQSTLYPMLYNLEAQGLVRATWKEGEGGRDRKYYALTPKGKERLVKDTEQLTHLTAALRSLGVLSPSAAAGGAA
ncbi:MAG: PadR family transcriptional regulator [Phycisphaerae bacterium]|nr:PadR family transcriptional regulator [Phycisphaerae bacterium]